MTVKYGFVMSLFTIFFGFATTALSCPENLKLYQTKYTQGQSLCQLQDRYQAALQKLRQQNIQTPERIGNLMAPRFINMPDWLVNRTTNPSIALKIYDPAPATWLAWEEGAKVLNREVERNFHQQRILPLTFNFLTELHSTALKGLLDTAGQLRRGGEIGMALNLASSLTRQQLIGLKNNEYRGVLNRDIKIVTFTPTQCLEHRTQEFQKEWAESQGRTGFRQDMWPMIDTQRYFVDENGIERQCGYFTYAPVEEVEPQLEKWLAYVNDTTANWGNAPSDDDPVFVAARIQRWFISIHPYDNGNGRVSRFIMEWLLQSLGLPAPILSDMNEDLYLTEKQWAAEIGLGLVRAVGAAQQCAQDLAGVGCAVIAKSLEGATP